MKKRYSIKTRSGRKLAELETLEELENWCTSYYSDNHYMGLRVVDNIKLTGKWESFSLKIYDRRFKKGEDLKA